ncbi:hypothetical protein [Stenotrophomonas phage BUCTxx99]|nr:hypothetical protein [Stenotrophomonas phage BUCTxx99]
MSSYIPLNFIHVDGDTTVQMSQSAFDPDSYRVILSQVGEGDIRREEFTDLFAAMQCYLGMIADELDQYAPCQVTNLVNRF